MTSSCGYSSIVDAILFLFFVSLCAVALSPVILGHAPERAASDRYMREQATDILVSLETSRVDYFEYRILGDVADSIASQGGINASNDWLYREMTRALLGRGSRHKTPMDIAAEDAACQFAVRYGGNVTRLNLLTGDFDRAAHSLIDRSIRQKLDSRYDYEYTLRWTPFTGVPLEGSVTAGKPHPPGAVSTATFVTMPYTTNLTSSYLEMVNSADLDSMGASIDRYETDHDRATLEAGIRSSIEGCLRNTTREITGEIWNNTLGSTTAKDARLDPSTVLLSFSGNKTFNDEVLSHTGEAGEALIENIVLVSNAPVIESLSVTLAENIDSGSMNKSEVRVKTLAWLQSRYEPSRARVTISIWVSSHA